MSRSTDEETGSRLDVLRRSAGEPLAETLLCRFGFLGVVIFWTPPPDVPLRELKEETRLILTRSAVAICGMERRLRPLSVDTVLMVESR